METTSSWILFSLVFWLLGYLGNKYADTTDKELTKIPVWAYVIICGNPKSQVVSNYTVSLPFFRLQVAGWLLILYGLFFQELITIQTNNLISTALGIVICIFLGSSIANRLSEK